MNKVEVGVLGGTGIVGQHFVKLLEDHPWFELTWLGASDRSTGKKLAEAVPWRFEGDMPKHAGGLELQASKPGSAPQLLFSAMDASVATGIEREFAAAGHIIVSNSRNHRMEPDVPLLIPEVNADHLDVLPAQRQQRGWSGAIITNPNCPTIVLTLALAPLRVFGLRRILATTLQAVSGAGYPGLPSIDILGNVIPFIGGEEEKIEGEAPKILGSLGSGGFEPLPAAFSAHCNRVAVVDGHTVAASVDFDIPVNLADIQQAWHDFHPLRGRDLPSAPDTPVLYLPQVDRPQARRDAYRDGGMGVTAGRLRDCPVLGKKFVCCGHNAIRGAAGAALLNAELMLAEKLIA